MDRISNGLRLHNGAATAAFLEASEQFAGMRRNGSEREIRRSACGPQR
jgi:hypothetical protein